jgi:hypothetical protein
MTAALFLVKRTRLKKKKNKHLQGSKGKPNKRDLGTRNGRSERMKPLLFELSGGL